MPVVARTCSWSNIASDSRSRASSVPRIAPAKPIGIETMPGFSSGKIARASHHDGTHCNQDERGNQTGEHPSDRAESRKTPPGEREKNDGHVCACRYREGEPHQEGDVEAAQRNRKRDRERADDECRGARDKDVFGLVAASVADEAEPNVVRKCGRGRNRKAGDDR